MEEKELEILTKVKNMLKDCAVNYLLVVEDVEEMQSCWSSAATAYGMAAYVMGEVEGCWNEPRESYGD